MAKSVIKVNFVLNVPIYMLQEHSGKCMRADLLKTINVLLYDKLCDFIKLVLDYDNVNDSKWGFLKTLNS